MLFNSFQFLWLFPIIFVVYYLTAFIAFRKGKFISTKLTNYLLIVISYGLYMQWNPKYALVLLGVTAITFFTALLIERKQAYGCKKYLIVSGTILALLPLLIFKYTDFIVSNLANLIGGGYNCLEIKLLAPIGISFYTFQAVGYMLDVYFQRIKAEHNWWDYMLFVCFFPQLLSGPISKAKDLLPQIKAERPFCYNQAVEGLKWLMWGMFLKVVMADRLALYVDPILGNYQYSSGISCLIAGICYTFQIYGDFAGYSFMAMGVGKLMGFDLINNFNRPYFSASISEFWHRWHISLSTWLKDYVYIPLGGSRCSKLKCYWNIFLTFLVSGIWHGANWTFVVWGMIHGVVQIIEKALGIQKCSEKKLIRVPRIIITFAIISFAWLIFRMPTIGDAWNCVVRMFTVGGEAFVPSRTTILFMVMSVALVIIVEMLREFRPGKKLLLDNSCKIVRWATYCVLCLAILLCGVFDSGQFIYINF